MKYFIKFGLISLFLVGIVSCHKALPMPEPQPQYDPRNISRTDSTDSFGPWIAIGPDGTIYVAWMDGGRGLYEPSRIYFRYKTPGGEWSDIEILSDSLHDAWAPVIAADPSGNVHLVWRAHIPGSNISHIFYRMRYPSGGWSETEMFGNGQPDQPRIAVDSSGRVHVIWCEGFGMKYMNKSPEGKWSEIESVPVGREGSENPSICADADGGVHISYEDYYHDIKYIYRSSSGEWSDAVNVSQSRYISWYGNVAIGEDGTVYVLWTDEDWGAGSQTSIIYYSVKTENSWTDPDSIPGTRGMPRSKRFFDHAGKHVLVWADGRYGEDIHYAVRKGRVWGKPQVIDTPGGSITVDAVKDREGNIHIVWSELVNLGPGENWEIYYEKINPSK